MLKKFLFNRLIEYFPGYLCCPEYLWFRNAKSQNDNLESEYLIYLAKEINAHKTFVEFGFHFNEFNSVSLCKSNYSGLLIDSDEENCINANKIFKTLNLNTSALSKWIEIEDLNVIYNFVGDNNNNLGILNIDIDGNDYWILKELISNFLPVTNKGFSMYF